MLVNSTSLLDLTGSKLSNTNKPSKKVKYHFNLHSFMAKGVEHFFMHLLAICTSSENCMSNSLIPSHPSQNGYAQENKQMLVMTWEKGILTPCLWNVN
jgi:hypothetical protein